MKLSCTPGSEEAVPTFWEYDEDEDEEENDVIARGRVGQLFTAEAGDAAAGWACQVSYKLIRITDWETGRVCL